LILHSDDIVYTLFTDSINRQLASLSGLTYNLIIVCSEFETLDVCILYVYYLNKLKLRCLLLPELPMTVKTMIWVV